MHGPASAFHRHGLVSHRHPFLETLSQRCTQRKERKQLRGLCPPQRGAVDRIGHGAFIVHLLQRIRDRFREDRAFARASRLIDQSS